jgi:hypothetical protein
MKKPREILLHWHRAAEPRLDLMRSEVIAQLEGAQGGSLGASQTSATILLSCWHELILPARRIWAGLAAVWLVIIALNITTEDERRAMVKDSPPPSREMQLVLKQQEALRAELLGELKTRASSPPRESGGSPRSEQRINILFA